MAGPVSPAPNLARRYGAAISSGRDPTMRIGIASTFGGSPKRDIGFLKEFAVACEEVGFDALYAPYYRQINDWIHRHTPWKTFKHSCGAVRPLIDRFIDVGFDILNPVQCSAKDMDPGRLKADFGDRIVFWGGGVDTQRTLPFGTPADVRAEVTARLRAFSPGGGFVFNTIHNIQARTPVANIVAMVDAIRDFNAG